MDGELAAHTFTEPLKVELLSECRVMVRHALSTGKELPRPVLNALAAFERSPDRVTTLLSLSELYGHLVRVVAPATPSGLRMIEEDKARHPRLHSLGPAPSIRYLMIAAILFSLVFFGVSLFPEINRQTLGQDIYDMSGEPLLIALTFLLSAAGLGATFGALFDAYQYVAENRYDTTFDSLYWARIGLGLVSGLMLAELVPQDPRGGVLLERPLLALLGGFSAPVVHRILQRLVGALDSLFTPSAPTDVVATERDVRQRMSEGQHQQRTALARAFDRLLEQVAQGGSLSDARKGLLDLVGGPDGGLSGLPSSAETGASERRVVEHGDRGRLANHEGPADELESSRATVSSHAPTRPTSGPREARA